MTDPEPPPLDALDAPGAPGGFLADEVRRLLASEEVWLAPPPELLQRILDCIAAESPPGEPR